jgi:hypothetical protein
LSSGTSYRAIDACLGVTGGRERCNTNPLPVSSTSTFACGYTARASFRFGRNLARKWFIWPKDEPNWALTVAQVSGVFLSSGLNPTFGALA